MGERAKKLKSNLREIISDYIRVCSRIKPAARRVGRVGDGVVV